MNAFEKTLSICVVGCLLLVSAVPGHAAQPGIQWVKHLQPNRPGAARAVALAPDGSIYSAGAFENVAGDLDIEVARYAPNGTLIDVLSYAGPDQLDDHAVDVSVHDDGSVYVTGVSRALATGDDIVVLKFDDQGNLIWSQRHDGIGDVDDVPVGHAVDAAGSVLVAGTSTTSTMARRVVRLKYSPIGTLLWSRPFPTRSLAPNVSASEVEVGANAEMYVAATDHANDRMLLMRVNANGIGGWNRGLTVSDSNFLIRASAVAVDGNGDVYIGGSGNDAAGERDILLGKFDTSGTLVWDAQFGGGGDAFGDLAVDGAGGVVVTGRQRLNETNQFGQNLYALFVQRFTQTAGGLQLDWTHEGDDGKGEAIATDSLGRIFVVAGVGSDVQVLSLSQAGALRWKAHQSDASSRDIAVRFGRAHVPSDRLGTHTTARYDLSPQPSLSASIVEPGPVVTGTTAAIRMAVANNARRTLLVQAVPVAPQFMCRAFRVVPGEPVAIRPGQIFAFDVGFAPHEASEYRCRIDLIVDGQRDRPFVEMRAVAVGRDEVAAAPLRDPVLRREADTTGAMRGAR